MNDLIRALQRSANLVKTWGQAQLANGKTLAEILTLDGLSLWDAVAVDLALYWVAPVLARGAQQPSWAQRIQPYLSWAKQTALDLTPFARHSPSCATWPPAPVFLVLGFSATMYRDVLQPVATCLAKREGISTLVLYDERQFTSATAWLTETGKFESVWRHWDDQTQVQARALRQALHAAVAELYAMKVLPQIIQDEGRSLWSQMEATFTWLFQVQVPRFLPHAAIAQHILEQHRPTLVISPDVADPRTRIYYLLGRSLGIPSLEIQYGMCGAEAIEYRYFVADRLAVWGEAVREVMLTHGVPAERIAVTGSPRHDSLVNVSSAQVAQARAQLGIPDGTAMILFASTYSPKTYDQLISPELINSMKRAVFQAADRSTQVQLVVKPHPLENVAETQKLAGAWRNIQFVDPRADIRDLIKVSDAFVSLGSAAILDALIAHKPTICPVLPGWVANDLYASSGAVLVPRSTEEIAQNLQTIVGSSRERIMADLEPARQRYLRQWAYLADGQASARIEALALQMANVDRPRLEKVHPASCTKDGS